MRTRRVPSVRSAVERDDVIVVIIIIIIIITLVRPQPFIYYFFFLPCQGRRKNVSNVYFIFNARGSSTGGSTFLYTESRSHGLYRHRCENGHITHPRNNIIIMPPLSAPSRQTMEKITYDGILYLFHHLLSFVFTNVFYRFKLDVYSIFLRRWVIRVE